MSCENSCMSADFTANTSHIIVSAAVLASEVLKPTNPLALRNWYKKLLNGFKFKIATSFKISAKSY